MDKVELHLHLEGAAPPDFIRRLAAEKRVDLSGIFDADGGYVFRDFAQFLETYEAACTVLTAPEDFARLTRAVLEESAAQGVIYTEAFLSPDFCGGGDLGAWREYLAAIEDAAAQAERDLGIAMRGIVTCIRHFGPDRAKAAARCAADTGGGFVTGFGMAGAEMVGAPRDFGWSFDAAREAGLRLTAHAGEWGGAEMVRATLDDLAPERIGHGIGAASDPKLCERLARDGIVLEVCPGSNVVLGAVTSWEAHPIQTLRERGVKVTISTDDPPFFHTTMGYEYERLADVFGWDDVAFADVNRVAIDAAFCDDATKDRVRGRLAG